MTDKSKIIPVGTLCGQATFPQKVKLLLKVILLFTKSIERVTVSDSHQTTVLSEDVLQIY